MSIKLIKAKSKMLIHGKVLKGLFITFSVIPFIIVFTVVSYFTNIILTDKLTAIILLFAYIFLLFLTLSSIMLGEKAWYASKISNSNKGMKRFIFWILPQNSIKAIKFKLTLLALKVFWSFITLLPSVLIFFTVFILASSGGIETYLFITLLVGGVIMMTAGLIFRFIILQRYFLAEHIISSNPATGIVSAIKLSKIKTENQLINIIRFKLSFLPLMLSCIFIFPSLFLIPYYKQSCSVIAKSISL